MSQEARFSVETPATPLNRYEKLLAALKVVNLREECDSSPASIGKSSKNPEINNNGESLSGPVHSSLNSDRESSPTPDISIEESPSDSCSAIEAERQDCSAVVYEIAWDHTMSGSDQEDEEESDSDSIDEGLYDKWYSCSSVADTYHDDWYSKIGLLNYEIKECFEDDENSYEVGEEAIKLEKLAHSDKSSNGLGKTLHNWSHDIEDDDRNIIYDKWISDLETWERQRLLWLDERGKIEGFDSSCDKDRTFLVKVGYDKSEKPDSRAGELQSQDFTDCKDLVLGLGECLTPDTTKCSDGESDTLTLPHDLTSVYEFTNRNLWRKYHNCFKEGKYTNNN